MKIIESLIISTQRIALYNCKYLKILNRKRALSEIKFSLNKFCTHSNMRPASAGHLKLVRSNIFLSLNIAISEHWSWNRNWQWVCTTTTPNKNKTLKGKHALFRQSDYNLKIQQFQYFNVGSFNNLTKYR